MCEKAGPVVRPFSFLSRGKRANVYAFIDIATELGCHQVLGASPLGNRLAAGVVALAGNGLRVFHPAERIDNVLVVDGLMITGVQVAQASQRAIAAGASRVCAAVVMTARPGVQP